MAKVNELSAMLVGWVSGFLIGLWSYSRLLAFLSWLERRLSGDGERKGGEG
ncbi:MAG: hypothetical protein QXQ61_04860 [Candidatus Bathyarchaeia archaeon]